jgi:cyclic pyranopterin phosphate synthase
MRKRERFEEISNPGLEAGESKQRARFEEISNPGLEAGESLTHTDASGRARMVDVGSKPDQIRVAIAEGYISLQKQTVELIRKNLMKKGDVLTVAEIAGIQAAKRTSDLIPLCHPLLLNQVTVSVQLQDDRVQVTAEVRCTGPTGVEMEALTAVSAALLTVYDMCKAVDKTMIITGINLINKTKHDLP